MASVPEQHHQQDAHDVKDVVNFNQNSDKEVGDDTITDAEVERVYR